MALSQRRSSDPDEPARLSGSRCPSCGFKLLRGRKDGSTQLDRRVKAVVNEVAGRWPEEIARELKVLNHGADEAERRRSQDSPEYRAALARIQEKWGDSVAVKLGAVALECPRCRTRMDPGDFDWKLFSRPVSDRLTFPVTPREPSLTVDIPRDGAAHILFGGKWNRDHLALAHELVAAARQRRRSQPPS